MARAVIAGLLLLCASAAAQTRPAAYSEFDTSIRPGDGAALAKAITTGSATAKYLYLQRGVYTLPNPVYIDRSASLFVHGASRIHTRIVARDPEQPLFVVRRATLIQFAGIYLDPVQRDDSVINAKALLVTSSEPITLEILDSFFTSSILELRGPGTYRLQQTTAAPRGHVYAPLVVDHPGADVMLMVADWSNGKNPLRRGVSETAGDYAHVWQKRGRIRVYAMAFEASLGRADVRIESPSPSSLGPHVLGYIRSEGSNGAGTVEKSRFLYVPKSSDRVDVVLKSMGGAWGSGESQGIFRNCRTGAPTDLGAGASYHAAGTLWLLGVRVGPCGQHLVEGDAPDATVVAIGGRVASPEPFRIAPKRLLSSALLYNHYRWTGRGRSTYPWEVWIDGSEKGKKLQAYGDIPLPPVDVVPPALHRPVMDVRLPGFLSVKDHGAVGDGVTDDTKAIQAALDVRCDRKTPKQLYFPKGTYRIRNTLLFNHHLGACRHEIPIGSWIAGSGSARTRIQMAPGVKKGTFHSDDLGYSTVQGLTFETWKWEPGDPKVNNVDVENYAWPKQERAEVNSQANAFYDVVFDGGYGAFAAGYQVSVGSALCAVMGHYYNTFRNAYIGYLSGHFNALVNTVTDSEFRDNHIQIGSTTDNDQGGGTWVAMRNRASGTKDLEWSPQGSAGGSTWSIYAWESSSPKWLQLGGPTGNTASSWAVFIERSRLTTIGSLEHPVESGAGLGPIFLDTFLSRAGARVGYGNRPSSQGYLIALRSEIPDLAKSEVGKNGRIESDARTAREGDAAGRNDSAAQMASPTGVEPVSPP